MADCPLLFASQSQLEHSPFIVSASWISATPDMIEIVFDPNDTGMAIPYVPDPTKFDASIDGAPISLNVFGWQDPFTFRFWTSDGPPSSTGYIRLTTPHSGCQNDLGIWARASDWIQFYP